VVHLQIIRKNLMMRIGLGQPCAIRDTLTNGVYHCLLLPMRKIIWTIAVVFCVQTAFQLAMSADRSNSEYAALRTPLQNGIETPSPPFEANDIDTDLAPIGPVSETGKSVIKTRVLIRYVEVPRSNARPAGPAQNTTAFKPVVITYDRTGALMDGSNTTAERMRPEKPQAQPDDNRSFIAKVVSKPYELVKAVGSKLR
jgi:hypothetical protein